MNGRKKSFPIYRPCLDEKEARAVRRVILSGWITQGPEVAAFEDEFASFVGARHACAVSSCTTALHLALKAVGVCAGDEVITVSHSFIATANAVRYTGATPVFVDITPDTYTIDPLLIDSVITPRTRAILCVHQLGMPCDMRAILAIARRRGLPVVEDAACAIGSEIYFKGRWQRIGRPQGDISCFSFHPRKLLTTGDGGMITTNNPAFDRAFRLWRQHGMSVSDRARHASKKVVFESYLELGYNYRMTDVQAAIGREQLKRMPALIKRRRAQAAYYRKLLSGIQGIRIPAEPAWARTNWQSFCIVLPERISQRRIMQSLADAGIATRRGVMCAHREPAYAREPWICGTARDYRGHKTAVCLAQSENVQDHGIMLPLFHTLKKDEQKIIVRALACELSGNKANENTL